MRGQIVDTTPQFHEVAEGWMILLDESLLAMRIKMWLFIVLAGGNIMRVGRIGFTLLFTIVVGGIWRSKKEMGGWNQ